MLSRIRRMKEIFMDSAQALAPLRIQICAGYLSNVLDHEAFSAHVIEDSEQNFEEDTEVLRNAIFSASQYFAKAIPRISSQLEGYMPFFKPESRANLDKYRMGLCDHMRKLESGEIPLKEMANLHTFQRDLFFQIFDLDITFADVKRLTSNDLRRHLPMMMKANKMVDYEFQKLAVAIDIIIEGGES